MKHIKLFEQFVNEKYSASDMTKLTKFAEEASNEIIDATGKTKFSPKKITKYLVEFGEMNKMTVDEIIDEWNWRENTMELGI
jgi:hypothetical protein